MNFFMITLSMQVMEASNESSLIVPSNKFTLLKRGMSCDFPNMVKRDCERVLHFLISAKD